MWKDVSVMIVVNGENTFGFSREFFTIPQSGHRGKMEARLQQTGKRVFSTELLGFSWFWINLGFLYCLQSSSLLPLIMTCTRARCALILVRRFLFCHFHMASNFAATLTAPALRCNCCLFFLTLSSSVLWVSGGQKWVEEPFGITQVHRSQEPWRQRGWKNLSLWQSNFGGVVLHLFERGGEGMLGCACVLLRLQRLSYWHGNN